MFKFMRGNKFLVICMSTIMLVSMVITPSHTIVFAENGNTSTSKVQDANVAIVYFKASKNGWLFLHGKGPRHKKAVATYNTSDVPAKGDGKVPDPKPFPGYEFAGWDKEFVKVVAKKEYSYTALFIGVRVKYTVNHINKADNAVLKKDDLSARHNETITAKPSKDIENLGYTATQPEVSIRLDYEKKENVINLYYTKNEVTFKAITRTTTYNGQEQNIRNIKDQNGKTNNLGYTYNVQGVKFKEIPTEGGIGTLVGTYSLIFKRDFIDKNKKNNR